MEFRIDLKEAATRDDIHDVLQEVLPLPVYYGRNLDALWDSLTDLTEEEHLIIVETVRRTDNGEAGIYLSRLQKMLQRLEKTEPNFHIQWIEERN